MTEINWDRLETIEIAQVGHPAFNGLSKKYVGGEGDNPRAMIIGEAPGAQEDVTGRPFVGPAGKVLRQLMALAGLACAADDYWGDPSHKCYGVVNCWLTNTVKFRPPGNRKPLPVEVLESRDWLRAEWQAVGSPRIIIPVGGVALAAITGRQQSILRAAGKMHHAVSNTDGKPLWVWPMVHPSFALRNPGVQPLIEQDWEKLGAWLAAHKG